jgi:hypothetical protein
VLLGLPARESGLAPGLGESLRGVLEGALLEGGVHLARVHPLVLTAAVEAALAAAEHAADALEGVGELARDDPHLVGVAAGDLREHLEVLVGEQLLGRLAAVDRVEDLLDRPGLALCLQDAGLRRALGAQDLALLLALGGEDLAGLGALGGEDDGAALALGLHLLLHRLLDGVRRVDGLELDAVDADAPLAGRLVEHPAQLAVDLVTAGQRLLEVERADDVAQRGDGELLDALDEVGDLVDRRLRVDDLVVDDRVDAHDEVVARDDRLRREGHDLLAQVDVGAHEVDERHEDVQAALEGAGVAAEALDDEGRLLGDDADRADEHDDHEARQEQQDDERDDAVGHGSAFRGARRGARVSRRGAGGRERRWRSPRGWR